jgi:hypothetical protein
LCVIGLLGLAGCPGSSGVKVNGKFVPPSGLTFEKGDTEKHDPGDMLQVVFVSDKDPPQEYFGKINLSDMSFTITGVPSGKYKVAVSCTPYMGPQGSKERMRLLRAEFEPFSPKRTPLSVDVSSSAEQAFTVDLKKKTVEPK